MDQGDGLVAHQVRGLFIAAAVAPLFGREEAAEAVRRDRMQAQRFASGFKQFAHAPAMQAVSGRVREIPFGFRESLFVPVAPGGDHVREFWADQTHGVDAALAALSDVQQFARRGAV